MGIRKEGKFLYAKGLHALTVDVMLTDGGLSLF